MRHLFFILLILSSFSRYSYSDEFYKITKIDCIPEIKYFEVQARISNSETILNHQDVLKQKYSLFHGDFSYECKIGIRKINIVASKLYQDDKYKGGIIKIFIDGELVHLNDNYFSFNTVVNNSEIYFFTFLSDSKRTDMVGIQHCHDNKCSWIKNDKLRNINYSNNY